MLQHCNACMGFTVVIDLGLELELVCWSCVFVY